MRVLLTLALCCLFVIAAGPAETATPVDPPPLGEELRTVLADWLNAHGDTPESYVVGLFSDHDVVFLGEQHRVKHDVLLVQSLMKPLYDAGVRVLATEFGRREDQPLIDSLLLAAQWNDDLAREIAFRQFIWWGYREYVDVYHSAWMLNRQLPEGAPLFKILGINDSLDWSIVKTEADRDDPKIMSRVWHDAGEEFWAEAILKAVRSGEKVLVHAGIHHAFTKYRQPRVGNGEFRGFSKDLRCGNHVFEELGERAVTVFLHAPWSGQEGYDAPMRHPADGIIDALMLAVGPRPVGFDLEGGPFAALRIEDAVYRHGYEDFRLGTFCDGWIYTKPISDYEGVAPIPGWITESNLEHARAQSGNSRFGQASIEEFNRAIARDAEIHRRWGHLR